MNNERIKQQQLNKLFDDWKKQVSTKPPIVFPDNGKSYAPDEYFATDGFFPGYFSANPKVLFMARETRWNYQSDIIKNALKDWNEDQRYPAKNTFWGRVIDIAYGIQQKGKVDYNSLPPLKNIIQDWNNNSSYGFAFMEASKYSNDSDSGATADKSLMDRFFKDSELQKRNFLAEEISILEPDLLITANLWAPGLIKDEGFESTFKNWKLLHKVKDSNGQDAAYLYEAHVCGKKLYVIDLFHFSAVKSEQEYFYDPVMQICRNVIKTF